MNIEEIEKVMKLFEASSIEYIEVESEGIKIKLSKKAPIVPATDASTVVTTENEKASSKEEVESPKEYVTSPLVGTFHSGPYEGAEPYVQVGDKVKKGQKLCIIEAMKVMNEIVASNDGTIKKIYVHNNEMVEYGQKLFSIGE